FAPELRSTQKSCRAEGLCLARAMETGDGIFGARPLGIYLSVPDANAPQPAASTPSYLYGFPLKMTPFSGANALLKLDDEGPQAIADNLGDHHSRCVMKLGMSFESFLHDCVEVVADPKENALLKQKVLGGATRTV